MHVPAEIFAGECKPIKSPHKEKMLPTLRKEPPPPPPPPNEKKGVAKKFLIYGGKHSKKDTKMAGSHTRDQVILSNRG